MGNNAANHLNFSSVETSLCISNHAIKNIGALPARNFSALGDSFHTIFTFSIKSSKDFTSLK